MMVKEYTKLVGWLNKTSGPPTEMYRPIAIDIYQIGGGSLYLGWWGDPQSSSTGLDFDGFNVVPSGND